jgi:hypothetical protein
VRARGGQRDGDLTGRRLPGDVIIPGEGRA